MKFGKIHLGLIGPIVIRYPLVSKPHGAPDEAI